MEDYTLSLWFSSSFFWRESSWIRTYAWSEPEPSQGCNLLDKPVMSRHQDNEMSEIDDSAQLAAELNSFFGTYYFPSSILLQTDEPHQKSWLSMRNPILSPTQTGVAVLCWTQIVIHSRTPHLTTCWMCSQQHPTTITLMSTLTKCWGWWTEKVPISPDGPWAASMGSNFRSYSSWWRPWLRMMTR